MRAFVVAGAIQGAWASTPVDMRATVPDNAVTIATIITLALGMIGRVTDQGIDNAEQEDTDQER